MIFLRAEGGLCNRLRAINSAWCVAQRSQHKLRVCWKIDPEMNCGFSSLFQPPAGFAIKDIGRESLLWHAFFSEKNFLTHLPGRDKRVLDRVLASSRHRLWSKGAYFEFYRPERPDYSWLKPKEPIAKEIQRLKGELGSDYVALHIRRTDNALAIKMSPLSLFVAKIEELIEKNEASVFFVATDDVPTKKMLRDRFGGRIFTRDQVARREDANGVADAVIDLFLLAGGRRLFGSYESSFSDVAADVGCRPYVRLVVKES